MLGLDWMRRKPLLFEGADVQTRLIDVRPISTTVLHSFFFLTAVKKKIGRAAREKHTIRRQYNTPTLGVNGQVGSP